MVIGLILTTMFVLSIVFSLCVVSSKSEAIEQEIISNKKKIS